MFETGRLLGTGRFSFFLTKQLNVFVNETKLKRLFENNQENGNVDLDHSCKKKAKKSSQNFKTNHLFERAVHSHGKNSLRD